MWYLENVLKASVNSDIFNKRGEKLGRLTEITRNTKGEVQYAIIASEHFAGNSTRYFAVPFSLAYMEIDETEKLVLDIEQRDLILARRIRFEQCPSLLDDAFLPSIYEVYEYPSPKKTTAIQTPA